jgi:thioredoxin-like negative regulator of GroEL
MIGFLLCVTTFAAAPEKQLTYAEAHQLAKQENRPMLILVGADWCPACRVMKQQTLSSMQQHGKLKDVLFAQVNVDDEPELAAQIMRSSSIPQLVLYTPAPQGWYRMYLQGAQSEDRIEGMIARGLELQRRDRALASKAQSEKSEPSTAEADE